MTYQDVDPKFGTWEDVKALGAAYDLQMECMVNHISPASKEFQDYLAKGDKSEFKEMFIDWNKLWGIFFCPCFKSCNPILTCVLKLRTACFNSHT